MRALLLAKAPMTSIGGLRATIRPSHEPACMPLRPAQRTTALAAMMEQSLQRSLAHTEGPPQALLTTWRALYRRQPDPGGEIAS